MVPMERMTGAGGLTTAKSRLFALAVSPDKTVYEEACHGWKYGEEVVTDKAPYAVYLGLAFPWVASAILAINFVGR